MIKPSDWKIEEMPDESESFYSGRDLTLSEFSKLSLGLKPTSMDDKWFIYCHEDCVYFHRSWTGHRIFIARIVKNDGRVFLGEVKTNKNYIQFSVQDKKVKKQMFQQIVDLVLRK